MKKLASGLRGIASPLETNPALQTEAEKRIDLKNLPNSPLNDNNSFNIQPIEFFEFKAETIPDVWRFEICNTDLAVPVF